MLGLFVGEDRDDVAFDDDDDDEGCESYFPFVADDVVFGCWCC